jgi:hypothetical protein
MSAHVVDFVGATTPSAASSIALTTSGGLQGNALVAPLRDDGDQLRPILGKDVM